MGLEDLDMVEDMVITEDGLVDIHITTHIMMDAWNLALLIIRKDIKESVVLMGANTLLNAHNIII